MDARFTDRHGKLIVALTWSSDEARAAAEAELARRYSSCDARSDSYDFDAFTAYYQAEMGTNLRKCFLSFADVMLIETLPEIKHATNALEQAFAVNGKRRVNIDPGYVTPAQMVLATTKPYTHRIYLGKGIHAEMTYLCRKSLFHTMEWTYPDYRTPQAIAFFEGVRQTLLRQMREQQLPA